MQYPNLAELTNLLKENGYTIRGTDKNLITATKKEESKHLLITEVPSATVICTNVSAPATLLLGQGLSGIGAYRFQKLQEALDAGTLWVTKKTMPSEQNLL